jgi:hypothetical protein
LKWSSGKVKRDGEIPSLSRKIFAQLPHRHIGMVCGAGRRLRQLSSTGT